MILRGAPLYLSPWHEVLTLWDSRWKQLQSHKLRTSAGVFGTLHWKLAKFIVRCSFTLHKHPQKWCFSLNTVWRVEMLYQPVGEKTWFSKNTVYESKMACWAVGSKNRFFRITVQMSNSDGYTVIDLRSFQIEFHKPIKIYGFKNNLCVQYGILKKSNFSHNRVKCMLSVLRP